MNSIKKLCKLMFNVVCIGAVILCGTLLFKSYVQHENPPFVLGYSPLPVMSGSMEPVFHAGDVIIIQKADDYQLNDIITFQSEGALITHRIIERNENGYVTKGDANSAKDEDIIQKDQIIGTYVVAIPWIGYLKVWISNPWILIILILGAVSLYLFNDQRKRRKTEVM